MKAVLVSAYSKEIGLRWQEAIDGAMQQCHCQGHIGDERRCIDVNIRDVVPLSAIRRSAHTTDFRRKQS